MEIYNEVSLNNTTTSTTTNDVLVTQKITDLLNTSNSLVKIREDRNVIG